VVYLFFDRLGFKAAKAEAGAGEAQPVPA
jgi:hypothetical protein